MTSIRATAIRGFNVAICGDEPGCVVSEFTVGILALLILLLCVTTVLLCVSVIRDQTTEWMPYVNPDGDSNENSAKEK